MRERFAIMQSRKQMKVSIIQSLIFLVLRTKICRLTCSLLINDHSMRLGPDQRIKKKSGHKLLSYVDRNKCYKRLRRRRRRPEWMVQN